MNTFTPLHKALGLQPGPLTDSILDQAIEGQVEEAEDLDWKRELPPSKGIAQTDVPKDIAAMANSGGGMIVYGVEEESKAATGRCDVGDFTERHESAYRSVAVTAISPPVFGLEIIKLGKQGRRAVAVIVPASVDGPHLIYKGEYFGAPIRNDADTVWMRERQIETMYRARFDERRHANEALDELYDEIAQNRDARDRAWLIAVARPRIPGVPERLSRQEAQAIFREAAGITLSFSHNNAWHPLEGFRAHGRSQDYGV
ncbi:ATP-binding protein [Actinobaculum sp. 313]|uniref:AlbA family DNA-binding domain-containing protein n=1 Tax=Actinobaculum sp. 313 TaxID=2495645 RepID=UPI00196A9FEA|nr:ATP-binding protein [Actinobaculum sp. 313]